MIRSFSKFHIINLFIVLIAIMLLSSCATITNGEMQDITVKSTPSPAKLYVNGTYLGETPGIIKLKRGANHLVEIKKEGYQTYKLMTSQSISSIFWANLICGGIIGIVIDLSTGSAYDIQPTVIKAVLDKGVGMNEKYHYENFTSINVQGENGSNFGAVKVVWE